LCVNVYCTTATGCQPNCIWQIYHIIYKIQAERNYCWEFSYLVVMYVCLLQIQIYYGTCRSIVKLIMLLEVINYFRVFCCIHCTEEEGVQSNVDLCGVSIVHYARIFRRCVVDRSSIYPLYSARHPFKPLQMKVKFIRHVLVEISDITVHGNALSTPMCTFWTYILIRIQSVLILNIFCIELVSRFFKHFWLKETFEIYFSFLF
jgi:hypothetical protein